VEKPNPTAPWWSPEAIAHQEAQVRALADQGQLDVRNDFASYRALADGRDPISAGLHHHNPYVQSHIEALCRDYKNIWSQSKTLEPLSVADLGCGVGYTTAGLKRKWPKADVWGFDVSQDAVRFARANWRECRFEAKAIDPKLVLAKVRYDLILCQEFYPFTRTASIEVHRTWFKFLLEGLTDSGMAFVTVSSANDESVNATYEECMRELNVHRYRVATPRISRRVPFVVSRLLGEILCKVKPEWARSVYIVRK
jgi:trans-aconitate methyltransferase